MRVPSRSACHATVWSAMNIHHDNLVFRQYYLDCLSQSSYLIGDRSSGRAVVVDPRRDSREYLADAAADGLTITHVVETHFHADFLSGHLELAAQTGAEIGVYGAAAAGRVGFPIRRWPTASASSSAPSASRSARPPATHRSRSASSSGNARVENRSVC